MNTDRVDVDVGARDVLGYNRRRFVTRLSAGLYGLYCASEAVVNPTPDLERQSLRDNAAAAMNHLAGQLEEMAKRIGDIAEKVDNQGAAALLRITQIGLHAWSDVTELTPMVIDLYQQYRRIKKRDQASAFLEIYPGASDIQRLVLFQLIADSLCQRYIGMISNLEESSLDKLVDKLLQACYAHLPYHLNDALPKGIVARANYLAQVCVPDSHQRSFYKRGVVFKKGPIKKRDVTLKLRGGGKLSLYDALNPLHGTIEQGNIVIPTLRADMMLSDAFGQQYAYPACFLTKEAAERAGHTVDRMQYTTQETKNIPSNEDSFTSCMSQCSDEYESAVELRDYYIEGWPYLEQSGESAANVSSDFEAESIVEDNQDSGAAMGVYRPSA